MVVECDVSVGGDTFYENGLVHGEIIFRWKKYSNTNGEDEKYTLSYGVSGPHWALVGVSSSRGCISIETEVH